jgi:serine/threonine protein kinase
MDPETTGQSLPPGTRLEEFVIERVLGSGGFGITYLARDTELGRRVVIKENLPVQFCFRDTHSLTVAPRHSHGDDAANFQWSLDSFSREAATLASLDHPGIVKVLRSFRAFGTAYFVMPFVEGITLDDLIKQRMEKGRGFSEEELLGLLTRVLDALGHLHSRGIYHRDIKPGNILITTDGVPVLIDFGAARQMVSERSMTVIESPGYTPFEQLQSRGNIGPWSDIYALAGTLYKMLTFESPPKAMDRVRQDPVGNLASDPRLAGLYSSKFLASIHWAFLFDERQRWQSAGEWSAVLAGKPAAVPAVEAVIPPPAAIPRAATVASKVKPMAPPVSTPLTPVVPPPMQVVEEKKPRGGKHAEWILSVLFSFFLLGAMFTAFSQSRKDETWGIGQMVELGLDIVGIPDFGQALRSKAKMEEYEKRGMLISSESSQSEWRKSFVLACIKFGLFVSAIAFGWQKLGRQNRKRL